MSDQKQIVLQDTDVYLQKERIKQQLELAQIFFEARCFSSDVKNPAQAFVKIQAGAELGMPPMEAMNSLYIVNGQITIYGMALTKRLREHGWKIEFSDESDKAVTATISKNGEKYSYTATIEELKKLGSRAVQFAPKDKLKWHAISRLVRFHVPEVTKGIIKYIKEEIEDLPMEEDKSLADMVVEYAGESITEKIKNKLEGKTDEEKLEALNKISDKKIEAFDKIPAETAKKILIDLMRTDNKQLSHNE